MVIRTVISLDRSDFIDAIYSLQVWRQLEIVVIVFILENRALQQPDKVDGG